MDAAGLRVERIDFTARAADEHASSRDGRLRIGLNTPGNAKAHLTLRRGTSAALIPASLWNRVLWGFHPIPSTWTHLAGTRSAWHIAFAGGVVTSGCPMGLPLMNSAMARRSAVSGGPPY